MSKRNENKIRTKKIGNERRLASDRQRKATNKENGDITYDNTNIWKGNGMNDRWKPRGYHEIINIF
jgi:hypothetical protein